MNKSDEVLRMIFIVVIIVAILIIIQSSWNLWFVQSVSVDEDLSDKDITALRVSNIIMLVIGALLVLYILWFYYSDGTSEGNSTRTSNKNKLESVSTTESKERFRERFKRSDV